MALPGQVLMEAFSASSPLLLLPASFSFWDWHTADVSGTLRYFLHMSSSGKCVPASRRLALGTDDCFPMPHHSSSCFPPGMKFADGTESLLEVYLLQELIMILIKPTTIAIY